VIAKVLRARKKGKGSFRDLINYIVGDRGEKKETNRAVYVGTRNVFSDTSENYWGIALEMNGLGVSNTRIKDPVFHLVLSFRPEEVPSIPQIDEAVEISLQSLGLQNCKTLYGLQTDNGIHHVHVCVCRIDPETGAAVNPGGGWYKNALREAAREIERKQGWERTGSDLTGETGKVERKSRPVKDPPPLRTGAQDFEAHMGEKSAQTVAIERAAGIIRSSRSWKELHEKLHSVGFAYRKKGSGAVIDVNGIFVKASDVGRDCALSQLEKRIGGYTETDIESRSLSAFSEGAEAERSFRAEAEGSRRGPQYKREPTKQTAASKKTLTAWQRYQIYCEDFREKKARRNAVFENQKNERAELKKLHKQQRDEMFKRSWKGQGKRLNQERMAVASRQLRDRILLREKQKQEQAELPALGKFLSYRKWLGENEPERIKDLRNWRVLQNGQKPEPRKSKEADRKGAGVMVKKGKIQIAALGEEQASYKPMPESAEISNRQITVEKANSENNEIVNSENFTAENIQISALGTEQASYKYLPELSDIEEGEKKIEYSPPMPDATPEAQPQEKQEKSEKEKPGEEKIPGIEAYQLVKNDDGESLSYSLYGETVAFIEKKDFVEVIKTDESALLAAMQVAQNKWGSVKVDGSKEQLDICAELAEKYRIKLYFPEKYVEEAMEEKKRNRAQEEIRERIESGKATVSDLRELRTQIARNCADIDDSLLKKSVEIMLSVDNESDNYPVTRHAGRKMLKILDKSIEQKELQQGKAKRKPESLTR
jgi:hypothetical protein